MAAEGKTALVETRAATRGEAAVAAARGEAAVRVRGETVAAAREGVVAVTRRKEAVEARRRVAAGNGGLAPGDGASGNGGVLRRRGTACSTGAAAGRKLGDPNMGTSVGEAKAEAKV